MLYLIPTPIGNLEDLSFRALRLLKEVDYILAEDTRQAAKLLQHYGISKPLRAYHAHNEHRLTEGLLADLQAGQHIALVSDAGTPGISDPGFLLARACAEAGLALTCLPGATAFVPALVISGLPCDRFYFEGFLPHKKGRQTRFLDLAKREETLVLYESPHRLLKTLEQLAEYLGAERQACVCREISKLFEEVQRGSLQELLAYYQGHPDKVRGEIVLVLAGHQPEKGRKKSKYAQDQSEEEEEDEA